MVLKHVYIDENENKSIWKIIVWRMNVHRITPKRLATLTEYSLAMILKGVKGEVAIVTDMFLQKCVRAFGLADGRIDANNPEDVSGHLTREECVRQLSPPPAMPTGQKNFWEDESSND